MSLSTTPRKTTGSRRRDLADAQAARFEAILDEAFAAATFASTAAMRRLGSDRYACGFSWVNIDGTEPLARYCRAKLKAAGGENGAGLASRARYGSPGYPKGWQWWNPGRSGWQNIDVKEIGARAFMNILGAYGIRVSVGSRLD